MNYDPRSTAQRLAETLKRCGIASSVHDAQRMANDITVTEKRVLEDFDEKRTKITEDHFKKLHANREQTVPDQLHDFGIKNYHPKTEVETVEKHEKHEAAEPLKIKVEFETPKTTISYEEDVLKSEKPLNQLCENEQKEDFINKLVEEEKPVIEASPAEEKEELVAVQQTVQGITEHKTEQKIDVNDYFNFAKKDLKPSEKIDADHDKRAHSAIHENHDGQSHPKTGSTATVDVMDYFNFAKRGKL